MPTTIPTDALTTRAKVKSYLGITDTSSDTFIDELITYATQLIKTYCGGRSFLSTAFVEVYDTFNGRTKIFLRQRPVITLTAVKYRGGTPSTPVWTVYDADTYLLYASRGYIHFYGELPEVKQGFQISYTAGYLIDFTQEFDPLFHTLPQDVTLAATMIVAELKNKSTAAGVSQETTEGQSVSYSSSDFPSLAKSILSRYKYVSLAK